MQQSKIQAFFGLRCKKTIIYIFGRKGLWLHLPYKMFWEGSRNWGMEKTDRCDNTAEGCFNPYTFLVNLERYE